MKLSIFSTVLVVVPTLSYGVLKPRNFYDTRPAVLVKPRYSDAEVAILLQRAGNNKVPILQRQVSNGSDTGPPAGEVSLAHQFNNEILDM